MVNFKNNKIVLNFSSTDNGGAGGAAYQFHYNLKKSKFKSFLFVARKTKKDDKIFQLRNNLTYKFQSKVTQLRNYLNLTDSNYWFLNSGLKFEINFDKITQIINNKQVNCIIVHSVPNFIDLETILKLKNKFNCKVFFRIYDMQNFTAGCSYSLGCQRYKKNCLDCPAIQNSILKKHFYKNFLKNKKIMKLINPEIMASSYFEMNRSKNSSLLKNYIHHYVPLGMNTKLFYPQKKIQKKNKKTIFLFGTSDIEVYRKGFNYFSKALKKIKYKNKLKIIFIGANKKYFEDLNIETEYINFIKNFKILNQILNSVHFCIIPSIDETGSTMLNISMLTSTPCITFDIGDAFNCVKNNFSGFKSKNKDIKNLSKNIDLAIKMNQDDFYTMKKRSRKVALKFFTDKVQISKINKIMK